MDYSENGLEEIIFKLDISANAKTSKFDLIIGAIEDIVVEEDFQTLQNNFFENNYKIFDTSEENKLEYYEIFKQYTNTIELYILDQLQKRIKNFNIEQFAKELEQRKTAVDGEIFDLLSSFSDFLKFKELILDFKAEKEGKFESLEMSLSVKKICINDSFNFDN